MLRQRTIIFRPRKKPIVEEDPDFDSKGVEEAKFPCLQCNKFKARKQHELDKHSFEKHASNRLCTQVYLIFNTLIYEITVWNDWKINDSICA